jgi:hypothetical protein
MILNSRAWDATRWITHSELLSGLETVGASQYIEVFSVKNLRTGQKQSYLCVSHSTRRPEGKTYKRWLAGVINI